MLRKFLSGSGIYAASLFMYSAIRQLVFLPLLHRYQPDLFTATAFILLTCDFLVFPIAGTLGDFYQRRYATSDRTGYKNKIVAAASIASILYLPALILYQNTLTINIISVLFIGIYANNNIIQRRIYNKLNFSEAFRYNAFRCIPFVILCGALLTKKIALSTEIIIFTVTIFEYFYYLAFLKKKTNSQKISWLAIKRTSKSFFVNSGIALLISTLVGAYLHRGEVVTAGVAWKEEYAVIVMLVTLGSIFVTPLALICSTPLMAFLTHHKISLNQKLKLKITATIIAASLATAALGYLVLPIVLKLFYKQELTTTWNLALSASILSLSIFFTTKTLIAKYSSQRNIILMNLTMGIIILLAFISFKSYSFIIFWLAFSAIRSTIPLTFFYLEKQG